MSVGRVGIDGKYQWGVPALLNENIKHFTFFFQRFGRRYALTEGHVDTIAE